jgi:hypothetical protein
MSTSTHSLHSALASGRAGAWSGIAAFPLTDILVLFIAALTIAGAWVSLNFAVPVVGITLVVLLLFCAGYVVKHKRMDVLLCFYIVSLPLLAGYDRYFGAEYLSEKGYILRIGLTQLVLVAVTLWIAGGAVFGKRKLFRSFSTIDLLLLVFVLYVAVNYFSETAPEPVITERFYGWIPYYLLVYIAARTAVTTLHAVRNVLVAIEISVCLVIVSRYFYQPPLAFLEGLYRIEVNYIYLSAVIYSQVLVMALTIAYYVYKTSTRHKQLYLLLLLLVLSEVIFSQTRGAYLAAGAAVAYYHYRTMKSFVALNWKTILAAIGVVFLVILVQIFLSLRELNQGGVEGSTLLRGLIMAYYFGEFLTKMWFGWGYGTEGVKSLYIEGSHNSFLSLAYDLGIAGVVLYAILIYFIFRESNRLIRSFPQARRTIVVIQSCVVSELVYGVTTGNNIFYSIPMQIIFIVLIIISLIPAIQYAAPAAFPHKGSATAPGIEPKAGSV